MGETMDRAESLELFSCIIRRLSEDFDELEKPEDRRRFANSLGALITQYDTISFRNRQDEIEKRITALEEKIKDE